MALEALISAVEAIDEVEVFGRVKTVQGLLIEVSDRCASCASAAA